jgi:hypothetical protein
MAVLGFCEMVDCWFMFGVLGCGGYPIWCCAYPLC